MGSGDPGALHYLGAGMKPFIVEFRLFSGAKKKGPWRRVNKTFAERAAAVSHAAGRTSLHRDLADVRVRRIRA